MTRNGSGEEDPGYRVVINRDNLKVGSKITFTVTFDDGETHEGFYEIYMAGEYRSAGEVIVENGNLVVESPWQLKADDYSKTIVVCVYTEIDSTNITVSEDLRIHTR